MRIALIDDDATTNFINKSKLNRELDDCEVFSFGNGKEAIDFLTKGNTLDIALLDMNMPKMNGLEFIKFHSELPEENQIKKIFFFIEQGAHKEFQEKHKVHQVLQKPLTKEIIELIIRD